MPPVSYDEHDANTCPRRAATKYHIYEDQPALDSKETPGHGRVDESGQESVVARCERWI